MNTPTQYELRLAYALAKQIPNMSRGFVIQTQHGEFEIPASRLAKRMQSVVSNAMLKELDILQQQRRNGETTTKLSSVDNLNPLQHHTNGESA